MKLKALLLLLTLTAFSFGTEYRRALPGYQFEFPRDHGNHPEFKLEWWYFTGNLQTREGRRFGYELTFFRSGLEGAAAKPSRWGTRDFYPAHFAVTDLDAGKFHFYEKLNRTSPGIAGAESGRLEVWNENWSARMEGDRIRLAAAAEGVAIELDLDLTKPPVIHGSDGVSQKGAEPGRASHYYSLTRLTTQGSLSTPEATFQVTGISWMDHEFATNQLEPEQIGWDWFSLQLDNQQELMVFQIRRRDGSVDRHSAATLVAETGTTRHLGLAEFEISAQDTWESPHTGGRYPVSWRLQIAGIDADLQITALLDDQELRTVHSTGVAYWEGAVEVSGRWQGGEVTGLGYLEMTGYAEQFRPRI